MALPHVMEVYRSNGIKMSISCVFYRTALHGMPARLSTRKLSVCPSVKRVDCDKTEEKSVHIFFCCFYRAACNADAV